MILDYQGFFGWRPGVSNWPTRDSYDPLITGTGREPCRMASISTRSRLTGYGLYGWFSSRHKGVFYISHLTKKGQKLAQEDTSQVIKNWRLIEEG